MNNDRFAAPRRPNAVDIRADAADCRFFTGDINDVVLFSSHQMSYVEEFCDKIVILNHGDVVLAGDLKEIKREFGQDRLVISALGETLQELAERLEKSFSDLLIVEKVQKDRIVIRQTEAGNKSAIMQRLLEEGVDMEFFGLYEPALNDIFVEKAGDEA